MTKRSASSESSTIDNTPSKKTKKNEIINDLNKDYQSAEADIIIIASDGLKFRVHSYHLMSASPVFRDMIAIGNKDVYNELHLTDKEIERSGTISAFLNLLYGVDLQPPATKMELLKYSPFIHFMRKYDVKLLLQIVIQGLRLWTTSGKLSPMIFFQLGAQAEDDDLVERAVRAGGTWRGSEREKDAEGNVPLPRIACDNVVGASSLDLTAICWNSFRQISDPYKFALLRASRVKPGMNPDGKWDKVGDEFKKVLEEKRREKLF